MFDNTSRLKRPIGCHVVTAQQARILTDEVKDDAAALWAKLLRLYEGGAHKALGYSSWGAYYSAEFGETGTRGYQLLDAARVLDALPHSTTVEWPSESAARELVPILRKDPERVEEVWLEASCSRRRQHGRGIDARRASHGL